MIRTSTHHFNQYLNSNKKFLLSDFIDEYRNVTQTIIDFLWDNTFSFNDQIFDVKNDQLNCPSFISTTNININSNLSERAIKCAATQACGIVKATVEKRKKRLYILQKLTQEGKNTDKLIEKLNKTPINKPKVPENFKCELNSICCDFLLTKNSFDGFIQLKSIGKTYGKIRIPIKFHRQSNKWKNKGTLKPSFLISKNYINIRWEIETPELKTEGLTIGADTGIKTCVSLSDGQVTKKCPHGHDLDSINDRLCRRKQGSKNFEKSQRHRENYVNWSINSLNLDGIKQINLERIYDINRNVKVNRKLKHWKNTLISEKLERIGEETGVHIFYQDSVYMSQRCSSCGYVHKSNRKGKIFTCQVCGFIEDSDINASKNHEKEYPNLFEIMHLQLNKIGFYILESGIFDVNGEKFTVSRDEKRDILPSKS